MRITVTIDSQVHAYERNHPGRPWAGFLHGPAQVTGDDMVAAMDAVGVDGALLISPDAMYRFDGSYALEVYKKHPGPVRADQAVRPGRSRGGRGGRRWAAKDGVVGVRIMLNRPKPPIAADPGLNQILAAPPSTPYPSTCSLGAWSRPAARARNPTRASWSTTSGCSSPSSRPHPPSPSPSCPRSGAGGPPQCSNQDSGACTLSHQPFPYKDIWDPLGRIFDAFGFDRCLWGTDWTRAVGLLTYKQGVEAFRVTDRLSDSDRAASMGGTLKRIYEWTPSKA